MGQVEAFDVDYTIHLGDVYPVGRHPFYGNFLTLAGLLGRRRSFNWYYGHEHIGLSTRHRPPRDPARSSVVSGTVACPSRCRPAVGRQYNMGPGKPVAGYSQTPYDDDLPEHGDRADERVRRRDPHKGSTRPRRSTPKPVECWGPRLLRPPPRPC